MNEVEQDNWQYFLTYSGVKLPLKLVSPLQAEETDNRNTFFRAVIEDSGRILRCQKVVYGEVEFEHYYTYYDDGGIKEARIIDADDETRTILFSEQGVMKQL